MYLLDQSDVTGERLDPYNVHTWLVQSSVTGHMYHVLLVNMGNMWMARFGDQ